MSTDSLQLLWADLGMVLSLFTSFVLNWIISWGLLPWKWAQIGGQHLIQVGFLVGWLSWIWNHDLSWVQATFFTLHTIAMLFKIHSYNETNREFYFKFQKEKKLKCRMVQLVKQKETGNDAVEPELLETQFELGQLELDLRGATLRYPHNITLTNFISYLAFPTLVYELEYPRTPVIRWGYILEKVLATFGTVFLMYITIEHYIVPVFAEIPKISFYTCLVQLIFPFMVCYLMTFYIMFECVCNGFAELSRYCVHFTLQVFRGISSANLLQWIAL
jgi:sterol O-acyltransferase